MFIFKGSVWAVCSLSTSSVDFHIEKAECHYILDVKNRNYRRRGEIHFLIEKERCQIQMLNPNFSNRIKMHNLLQNQVKALIVAIHLAPLQLSSLKNYKPFQSFFIFSKHFQ